MSKKIILLVSGVASVVIGLTLWKGNYSICNNNGNCVDVLHYFFIYFFIFLPIFILSLITYKLRNEIFRAWIKFSYVWLPLTVILTLLAPEYDSSLLPITKSVVSFSFSALYLLVSLSIILVKSLSSKSRNSK